MPYYKSVERLQSANSKVSLKSRASLKSAKMRKIETIYQIDETGDAKSKSHG